MACAEDTELSLVITDNAGIEPLNRQYLGRQGPTNVIAFPMGEGEFNDLNPSLLGDVVVSLEYAVQEAKDNGLDPDEHFLRLIIHGILHLLGYDHVNDEDEARRMEELTESLLSQSASPAGR